MHKHHLASACDFVFVLLYLHTSSLLRSVGIFLYPGPCMGFAVHIMLFMALDLLCTRKVDKELESSGLHEAL